MCANTPIVHIHLSILLWVLGSRQQLLDAQLLRLVTDAVADAVLNEASPHLHAKHQHPQTDVHAAHPGRHASPAARNQPGSQEDRQRLQAVTKFVTNHTTTATCHALKV